MSLSRPRRTAAAGAALALLLTACAGGDAGDGGASQGGADGEPAGDDSEGAQAPDEELAVFVASYDVAVGDDQRLLAGVLTADAAPVVFGEVDFEVGPVGPEGGVNTRDTTTAGFLPVPGLEPEGAADQPQLLVGEEGRGVYEGRVTFDEPGTWAVQVTAELDDGTTRTGTGTFEVGEEAQIVAVGEEAPRTENLTVEDVEAGDATPISVDSRAQGEDEEIPDPQLHDTTIADALDTGDPLVVVVSTPTYCRTAFCGPLTELMGDLAEDYEGRAGFVHLEVWKDFDAAELNAAAAEWIQPPAGDGNEPWVFLVDGDGTVQGRWDNVVDVAALQEQLDGLV